MININEPTTEPFVRGDLVIVQEGYAVTTLGSIKVAEDMDKLQLDFKRSLYRYIITILAMLTVFGCVGGSYIIYRLITGGIF